MKPTILVVDDNPTNLAIMEEILVGHYELVFAASGEECLELVGQCRPDIVLLDIMMPGIDGYETCRRLREREDLSHTKVVLVSARAMFSERLAGYEAGADDYLTKPFREEELLAKLRIFLRLKNVEEVNKLKTDILSLIQHDLRTPLNGLVGAAGMLASPGIGDRERGELAEIITSSADRLLHFFDRAVFLSRLTSGEVMAAPQPDDLQAIVRHAVDRVRSAQAERKVSFRVEGGVSSVVAIDRRLLTDALVIVLDNAVDHSPEGAEVCVRLIEGPHDVTVAVSDCGSGIRKSLRSRLFEAFHGNVRHGGSGTGMNLAIARQILAQHDGNIRLDEGVEQGATFLITLPVAQVGSAAA
jgi:signal transduction histidine kinase